MEVLDIETLRFPIGHYEAPETISQQDIDEWIEELATFPLRLRDVISGFSVEQLNTPYREGGWMVKQVVHHLVDSHMNSLIRFKTALTEEKPAIRPYNEAAWAELPDDLDDDLSLSLDLLELVHAKLVLVLRAIKPEQMPREFSHPEYGDVYRIDWYIGNYAWHCAHHLAHITTLADREGWSY